MRGQDRMRVAALLGVAWITVLIAGALATPVVLGDHASGATPVATPIDIWAPLHRPLRLSSRSPAGDDCPHSEVQRVTPHFGPGLGDGPVHAAIGPDATISLATAREDGGWFYIKVLWYASPAYDGPILVRGRQLDGPAEVRFEWGANPTSELRLDGGGSAVEAPGWRHWPTYTRVPGPGCYAYQVDGTDFSEVIVFEVQFN